MTCGFIFPTPSGIRCWGGSVAFLVKIITGTHFTNGLYADNTNRVHVLLLWENIYPTRSQFWPFHRKFSMGVTWNIAKRLQNWWKCRVSIPIFGQILAKCIISMSDGCQLSSAVSVMPLGLCFWQNFCDVKRTWRTTGSWLCCLIGLGVTSSNPAWSTIIYRLLCGWYGLFQNIKVKPTNIST